jgi:GH15 family glucan-1,4-alpha-glucosidase
MYSYGLVGNCQASALVNNDGSIDWLCLPRPDSPPIFGKILDSDGGSFSIIPKGNFRTEQSYIPNTNVLVTCFFCDDGTEFKITDFCPRFWESGRLYRPLSLFRLVEPIKGTPVVKITSSPILGWEKQKAQPVRGNSHVGFEIRGELFRITTNMSLTYFTEESEFSLNEKLAFALTWGLGIEGNIHSVTEQFLAKTIDYWRLWVKHLTIPTLFQKETIRSALVLKLHCYEDTGAILAALTTSLPEEAGSSRNWDYRYCWLRDSAFLLSAFYNLGQFEEMEGFLKFLFNIGQKYEHSRERLRPVYALDQTLPIPELTYSNWEGFQKSQPVRSNNQAAEHVQNDVYGEMILTFAPLFFDERFQHLRTKEHEDLIEKLGRFCVNSISQADAGLWELRFQSREHSFTNLMAWAGIDRAIRIKELGFLSNVKMDEFTSAKKKAEEAIEKAVKDGCVRNGPGDDTMDAALLLLPVMRYTDKALCKSSVLAIYEKLKVQAPHPADKFLYRYIRSDDFGVPHSAFVLCSYWLVHALARVGENNLAYEVMTGALKASNNLGLISEHFDPIRNIQCGNYPQAYSHVGLINAAFSISPSWAEVL